MTDWAVFNQPWQNLSEKNKAISLCKNLYKQGSIVLVLGAGFSKNLGFPLWKELVCGCNDLDESEVTNENMNSIMAELHEKLGPKNFYVKVGNNLYNEDVQKRYANKFLNQSLYNAIAFLCSNYKIKFIINYNFDDSLEIFFDEVGIQYTKVVDERKILFEDNRIFIIHPHGFIPSNFEKLLSKSGQIILDDHQYLKYSSKMWDNGIFNLINSIFLTYFSLFIGLSGSDNLFRQIIENVFNMIKKKRPIGYIFHQNAADLNKWFSYGLIPLDFKKHTDYNNFLMEIRHYD